MRFPMKPSPTRAMTGTLLNRRAVFSAVARVSGDVLAPRTTSTSLMT